MKKKILFVIPAICVGGSMTSLLNLLELFKNEYGERFDLLIMEHTGVFLDRAKKTANVLPENKKLSASFLSFKNVLKRKKIIDLFYSLLFIFKRKITKYKYSAINVYEKEAKKYKGYDLVISYQEGICAIFTSFIEAKEKITWFHQEYKYAISNETQKKYYEKFDKYVCVSDVSRKSIIENLSHNENNTFLIYNTFNVSYFKQKSLEYSVAKKENIVNLVSCGRVSDQKKFDRVIYASKKLKEEGYKFYWRVVGGGNDLEQYRSEVLDNNLQDYLEFVGPKTNPYPYFAASDCFVLSSLYEAHPMVVVEAFSLGIPVVSTDFPSVREVITDGVDGIIGENSEDGVYTLVKNILDNPSLIEKMADEAKKYVYDNNKILNQIKFLLEN